MQTLDYLDTAYDSTRPRELPPAIPDEQRNWAGRQLRSRKLDPLPVACAEYLVLEDSDSLEMLQSGELNKQGEPSDLSIEWMSFSSPLTWALIGRFLCGLIAVMIFAAVLLELIITLPRLDATRISGMISFAFVGVILLVLRYVLDSLIKNNKIPDRNNTIFNRRTGMVHLPPLKGQERIIPFDEFAPYQSLSQSPHGLISYHLMLGHKYSGAFVVSPSGYMDPWRCYLDWEFHQQYMDISKPLPDTPHLETQRALDPTTIEWDKKMNRPPDFWLNSPDGGYAKLSTEAWTAAETFPWGASRQDALAAGWRPSPFGKQTWWASRPRSEQKRKKC